MAACPVCQLSQCLHASSGDGKPAGSVHFGIFTHVLPLNDSGILTPVGAAASFA